MLISQQKKRKGLRGHKLLWGSSFLLLSILSYFYFTKPPSNSDLKKPEFPLFWDLETRVGDEFIGSGNRSVGGGATQSEEEAYSGKFSCLLDKGKKASYGLTCHLPQVNPGEVYQVTVWRKKMHSETKAFLVAEGAKNSGFYLSTERVVKQGTGGWFQLELLFLVPGNYPAHQLKVYVFSNGHDKVYWDDLRINKIESSDSMAGFSLRRIDLKIADKAYRKLAAKRNKAIKAGILKTEADSWVKGQLQDSSEIMDIKLRLKGDWLDHLSGNKWSFRIKVKDPSAWNRLKEFSFHTPQARYYALEWLLHQFWEREGVLTTRYDFVHLYLNNQDLGIYAYEEHFDKQLLEYRSRREGPILKFSEDALWDSRLRQLESGRPENPDKPAIARMGQSEIAGFKETAQLQNPDLKTAFEIGSELLYAYQQGLRPADEIFELKQVAKYYAIADIMGAHHGLIWHNQRFYFNPVLARLELIGFDGYSNLPRSEALLLGKELIENGSVENISALKQLFENESFIKYYMHFLLKYSEEEYLEDFLNGAWPGLEVRVDLMKSEFPDIKIKKERILERAFQIRAKLLPYNDHSVKASWKRVGEGKRVLQISNYHELPLQVVGFGNNRSQPTEWLPETIALAPFYIGHPQLVREEKVNADYQYIFYRPFGIDTLFHSPISSKANPASGQRLSELLPADQLICSIAYEKEGNLIRIKKGNYTIQQNIHIPAGLEVHFQSGVMLNLINGAGFISRSAVFINGTAAQPVIIRSGDQSGSGFTILQAARASVLNYCTFDGLNSLKRGKLSLTGALTFYESDLRMNHCLIKNNQCEDALNCIRSQFEIDDLTIEHALYDGFDADFCSGSISNSKVKTSGNDGFDFSGSQIQLYQCEFENCGDKGISVGEESKVEINRAKVVNSSIGLVSKDLSYVRVRFIELIQCNQGFAAYQKKPEYGHSSIVVDDYLAKNVRILHTVATRCTLELKNQVIIGE